MQNWKRRVLSVLLALCTIVGLFPAAPALTARAAGNLVNVAPLGSASTTDGSYQTNVIENVIDGDLTTNWQTMGVWPATAVVQLDMGRSISEVAVKLGGDDMASRTVTVTVEYAQNGVVSDPIALGSKTVTLTGSMEARFALPQAISATHFFVTLSDPGRTGPPVPSGPASARSKFMKSRIRRSPATRTSRIRHPSPPPAGRSTPPRALPIWWTAAPPPSISSTTPP